MAIWGQQSKYEHIFYVGLGRGADFTGGSDGEDSTCNAGDTGSISRKILWRRKMETSEAKIMNFPEMIFTNHFQRRFSVIHRLAH